MFGFLIWFSCFNVWYGSWLFLLLFFSSKNSAQRSSVAFKLTFKSRCRHVQKPVRSDLSCLHTVYCTCCMCFSCDLKQCPPAGRPNCGVLLPIVILSRKPRIWKIHEQREIFLSSCYHTAFWCSDTNTTCYRVVSQCTSDNTSCTIY